MPARRKAATEHPDLSVLDPLIDAFCEALWLEDGLSKNTLAAYRRDRLTTIARKYVFEFKNEATMLSAVKHQLMNVNSRFSSVTHRAGGCRSTLMHRDQMLGSRN